MSVRVQTYVWQLGLPPNQKLVAIALADHCHDDGSEARPSQALLASKTGLDVRTVRRTLHRLVADGVIVLERQSGQHRPNAYRFPLPDDFATLRPVTRPPQRIQTGQNDSQTGHPCAPDRSPCPPNHKEPSVETNSDFSIDIHAAADRLRAQLKGSKILGGGGV